MFPSPSANYLWAFSSFHGGRLFRHKLHPIKLRPFCIFPRLASKNIYERKSKSGKHIELVNKNRKGKLEPIGLKITKSSKPVAEIFHGMTLRQFATILDKDVDELGEHILENGIEKAEKYLENPDETLDWDLLLELVSTLRMRPKVINPPPKEHSEDHSANLDLLPQPPIPKNEWQKRAPVVTIMGHVDHGKTTLLDALRHSNIVAGEFGGITQHIGAFSVKLPDVANKSVTFLDTPGHAAFKAMRERGARATDIVVLVVAADDGVMEQTIESINYAREAGVPIIVAVNKCDKPGVDPEKVLNELLQHEIIPEKYGGETQIVQMSALYKRGIDKLQEAILLQAELLELHSTPKGAVEATIIESSKIQGLGIVTTLIVNRGTLKRGTVLVAGTSWAKVRTMTNEFNENVKEAGPSTPVRISGWHYELPAPGELALEAPNEGRAQSVVNLRKQIKQETIFTKDMELVEKKKEEVRRLYHQKRMENFQKGIFAKIGDPPPAYTEKTEEEKAAAKIPSFPLIIKCDVDGTLEAIQDVLATYNAMDQVRLDIVHSNVGILAENDLEMAAEFNAHIFTFNTPIPARIQELAKQRNIHIEEFHVIYKLVERLKELLSERIKPEVEKHHLGEGTVLVEYRLSEGMKKRQPIAGIRVDSGIMDKKAIWRFTRINHKKEEGSNDSTILIYEGPIESMQHQKMPINEAKMEMEIGIAVEDKNVRYKEGDRVECYENVVVEQKIGWDPPGF